MIIESPDVPGQFAAVLSRIDLDIIYQALNKIAPVMEQLPQSMTKQAFDGLRKEITAALRYDI